MPQPVSLCGWLLPGPVSTVLAGAPFASATCAAVVPLPYCFDPSAFGPLPLHVALEGDPPRVQVVHLWVLLLGLTPGASAFACCFACPGGASGLAPGVSVAAVLDVSLVGDGSVAASCGAGCAPFPLP